MGPGLPASPRSTSCPAGCGAATPRQPSRTCPLGSNDVFGCEIARRGIIREVSVLSPSVEPAEPLAKVLTLHPTEPKTSTRVAAGDTLLAPGRIVRRGIGQVLGVR